jgi:poly(3-hydroxybutyrate) depolymerase
MKGQGGRSEALHVPTIVFHGDADATVHARNGAQLFATAAGEGDTLRSETFRPDGSRRSVTRHRRTAADGRVVAEHWVVHGAGHAWFGGDASGSYTDPDAPDASAHMLRFFLAHRHGAGG